MKNYGIPYMGSKQRIVASLAMNFPKADHFYDLFGGGFSISHYMLENKKNSYIHFHYNEIKHDITELVKSAINGDFNYDKFKPEWISREEFEKRKETDAYIKCIWSFGNNQKDYLFSKDIEHYKKSMHMAVVFNEFDDLAKESLGINNWPDNLKTIVHKRLYIRNKLDWYNKHKKIPKILWQFLDEKQLKNMGIKDNVKQLERLQRLEQLEQLQRLEQLEQLERLEQLHITSLSYGHVEIFPNSIVYCDIPYENTRDYGNDFNRKQFLDWAATRDFPVYISEYNIDDSRFKCVYFIDKLALLCNIKETKTIKSEKLYWNRVTFE